ncbi:DUF4388 domain-containing protein [Hyalangium minutum]|uniref:PatA-like N-terminal domain-containing protein n=1 Tax=Hyalangium minutum TaxID=394096 RepID=A0A085WXF6_9BACT|nr:DUF4388 domain-containing protein [Hyalangium minutum]KFE72369.1 hypothetical protein DB31_0631 [Hyalangium minutum]
MTPPRFRIDGSSQLVPEERQSPPPLAGRTGSYALMTTAPDLLVFSRVPAQGGTTSAPRVVLTGDASGFPLSDLIAFLSQSRWSGLVRVRTPGTERSLTLREGEVRGASSDDPSDRLGEVLVRLGYVDRAKIEQVLREQPPSKVGRALVERGYLQAHDLFKCVTHQVSEIFHAIVLCREGSFFLIDQPVDDKASHIQLSTQSLLMDSIRKIDELAHFRKRIPHGRLYVGPKRASDGKLEADEDRVLALLDGRRTILELGFLAKLSEFDITKVVFRLLEGGYAVLSEQPLVPVAPSVSEKAPVATPSRPAPFVRQSRVDHREVVRVFNLIFKEIRDEVARKGMDSEFIAAANVALSGQALTSSPVLQGLSLAADGTLAEPQLIEAFERHRTRLGSEPIASFKQALSDVMFFLLFQAGELLESRADEDLARRVKELLATLESP